MATSINRIKLTLLSQYMKKNLFTTALAVMSVGCLNAQVTNLALEFNPTGTVDCGGIPEFNNLNSYSIQFWINPTEWNNGATILNRGENFSITLGNNGNIVFHSGNTDLTSAESSLKIGEWTQVTLICKDEKATLLFNGKNEGSGDLNGTTTEDSSLIIGGGFTGLIDEIRIWDDALNEEMESFDYFTNNTLNKWCPMWDNLLVYYKMDQENCPYLADYKGIENQDAAYDNHGIISEGVFRTEANNDKMPYLVNAAYTENSRFFDRIIPRDQYLLSNEIIILGADCEGATGHIKMRTPNNHAVVEGAKYISSFEGREGILELEGTANSRLVIPAETWNSDKNYGFETWIYLEEWTPNAFIFRKETEDGLQGVSLRLGTDPANPYLIARINGEEFISQDFKLPIGEWSHIGMAPGTGGTVIRAIMFFLGENSIRPNVGASTTVTDIIPIGNEEIPIYMGEGLKAKFDDTAFWKMAITIEEIKKHMANMPMPTLDNTVVVEDLSNVSAFYRYDNPENLGHSYHSQDEWANIMRSAYDGHYPAKFSLSVRGHDSTSVPTNFTSIINDEAKRKIFAQDLAEISKNYDGVELDLEWIYNWTNYSLLADEIIKVLPEGKTFRISTHNVSYNYPQNKINDPGITGFTFQQYGPQKSHFNYKEGFTDYIAKFLQYGYPADKILSSYSTTTSKGVNGSDILGVRTFLSEYEENDGNIDSYTNKNDTWYYMGPMQVYRRAKYSREQNLQGIFYWDMGNDYWEGTAAAPVMPKYNSAKYCSFAINSNCDPIADPNLKIKHYGDNAGINIIENNDSKGKIVVYPSPAYDVINVTVEKGTAPHEVKIFSGSGNLVKEATNTQSINISNLTSGIYHLSAKTKEGKRYNIKFIKK